MNDPIWIQSIKIIYWSCNVRNTQISLALRRPTRLHQIQTELFPPDEIIDPSCNYEQSTECISRLYQLLIFVWSCKICRTLNNAVAAMGQAAYLNDNGVSTGGLFDETDADEQFRFSALSIGHLQLLQIQGSESKLMNLRLEYINRLEELKKMDGWTDAIKDSNIGSFYMNEIITL